MSVSLLAVQDSAKHAAERFFMLGRELLCVIDGHGARLIANGAIESALGYPMGEPRDLSLSALLHPDDRARAEEYVASLRSGASEVGFRCRLRQRDGAYRTFAWHGTPPDDAGSIHVTGRDVSEVLRVEAQLRISEERFRSLDAVSPIGVFESDLRGVIVYANRRLQEIVGSGHNELADGSWMDVVHPHDAPRLLACLEDPRIMSSGQEADLRLLLSDGRARRVRLRTAPRHDDSGALLGTLGTVEDFTDRLDAEEQLRQAQKMEAVGQLAGGVAHDFNNLLTVIKTYCEFLLEQIDEDSPLRADTIEIQKAAGRAAALTRQLLAFSRKQVLLPRAIDVNEIVLGMEPMLRRLLGEDVRIELRTATRLGSVKADAGQLEQVVMNLAVNARDAMPQGGTISIETCDVQLGEHARGGHGVIPGPYVSMVVRDTGCGMDRATRARVFEPFFTTKEMGRGTGLGLSMVYAIVKQSEGYIWCESQEGEGTTFTVLLPEMPQADGSTSEPDVATPDRGSGVVLVTEDEDAIRALSRRVLEREGYTVLEARDGREAMRVAAGYPSRIDLLVTDMVMPNVGGTELFAHLRILRPDMRVLFVSGYTDDDIIRRGLRDEKSAFLQKPFTARALAAAAQAALGE